MLDTFIIDRIRREQERERDAGYRPLRIERPAPRDDKTPERVEKSDEKRGSVVIDFQL